MGRPRYMSESWLGSNKDKTARRVTALYVALILLLLLPVVLFLHLFLHLHLELQMRKRKGRQ